jgi:hypothetical protein
MDRERWCRACKKIVPSRYMPSSDAGPYWRCSQCGEVTEGLRSFLTYGRLPTTRSEQEE